MKPEKMDRRVKYTKHQLQEALIALLETYSINKISVSMLCEKADVNRSTFYAHYENAFQLLEQMERQAMADLQGYILSHSEPYKEANLEQTMLQIMNYVEKNARLFRALLGKNGGWDFKGVLIQLLNTELTGILTPQLRENRVMFDYVTEFSVSGSISVILRWLETGLKEPPEDMAKMVTHMLLKNVAIG